MLLLFTTCQSATTGSRSNLHRSVLYFFTFIHLFSDTFKMSLKKKIEFVWAFSGDGLAASVHSDPLQVKQSTGRSTIWGLVLPIIWRQNRDPLFKLLAADRIGLNNDAVTLYCAIACAMVMTLMKTHTDTGRVDYKYLEQRHDMFDTSGYH
jgi:hypothetical protein